MGEQLNRTESVCSRKPESRIRPAFYGRPVCDVLFSSKRNPRASATGPMDDTLENDINVPSRGVEWSESTLFGMDGEGHCRGLQSEGKVSHFRDSDLQVASSRVFFGTAFY